MSKNLTSLQTQLAAHEVFGQFRYIVIDGEIYFVAVDVCKILGYKNSRKAIADHVDDEDKNTVTIRDGIPGNPNKVIINESGLYSLIFGSNLPQSKKFTRWVTSEVLPSIRKTGSYSIAPKEPPKEITFEDWALAVLDKNPDAEFEITGVYFEEIDGHTHTVYKVGVKK